MNTAIREELLCLLQLKKGASWLGLPQSGPSVPWRLLWQHSAQNHHNSLSLLGRKPSYHSSPDREPKSHSSDVHQGSSSGGLPTTKESFSFIVLKGLDSPSPVNITRHSKHQEGWPQPSTVQSSKVKSPSKVDAGWQGPSPTSTSLQSRRPSLPVQHHQPVEPLPGARHKAEPRARVRAHKQPVDLPEAHLALKAKYWCDERLAVAASGLRPAYVWVQARWDRVCVLALDAHTTLHTWMFIGLEWLGEARHTYRQQLHALSLRLQQQLQAVWSHRRQQVQELVHRWHQPTTPPATSQPKLDLQPHRAEQQAAAQTQPSSTTAGSTTSSVQQQGLTIQDVSAVYAQPRTPTPDDTRLQSLQPGLASPPASPLAPAAAQVLTQPAQPASQPAASHTPPRSTTWVRRAPGEEAPAIHPDVLSELLKQKLSKVEPKHLTAQVQKLRSLRITHTLKERKIDIDNGLSTKLGKDLGKQEAAVDIRRARPSKRPASVVTPPHVSATARPTGQERSGVDTSAPTPVSAADVRKQELRQGLDQLAEELQELQGRIRSYQDELGPSPPSTQLDLSRYRPVLQLAGQVNKLQEQLKMYEAELQLIESGGWCPPQRETHPVQEPSAQGVQAGDTAMPAPEADLAAALDDLLLALEPGSVPKTTQRTPSGQAAVSRAQQAAAQQQATRESLSLGLKGVAPGYAPGSTTRRQAVDQSAAAPAGAAPQVASWVDDLRDVLGAPGSQAAAAQTLYDDQQAVSGDEAGEAELEEAEAVQGGGGAMEPLEIPAHVSVRVLAGLLGCRPATLDAWLRDVLQESPASAEDSVSAESAELAALEWGYTPLMHAWANTQGPVLPRQPVVAILGHVDHGKTSLLDALRNTSVAASEAGGITQHIGAFEVQLPGSGQSITFLDTPGHAAFSAMRARGAAVTDIVILVVAADDGVMPQTREALAHARSAGCPIVVALTKCDLPSARPDAVKAALLAEGLELEEYGGSVQVVHTSARTALGLQELQEALQLQAEVMELKAACEGPAVAVVVEASQGRSGPQATVVVQQGRLKVGDPCVVGTQFGKIRAVRTSTGRATADDGVGPGQHALVLGLRGTPAPGDKLQVVGSEERARRISEARAAKQDDYRRMQLTAALHSQRRQEASKATGQAADVQPSRANRMSALAQRKSQTAKQLAQMAATGQVDEAGSGQGVPLEEAAEQVQLIKDVKLVVKADVQGSVEAVCSLAQQCSTPHVAVKVLHAGVGALTPGDVHLALAAGAHLVTFNLGAAGLGGPLTEQALTSAKQAGITLMSHNIIYHLMDELRSLVEGATPFIETEEVVGTARVLASFPLSATSSKKAAALPPGGGRIAGLRVDDGHMQRAASRVQIIRGGQVVHEGRITSLKRHKLDVDQVGKGTECGLVVDHGEWSDWQQGDIVQCLASVRQRADAPRAAHDQALRESREP